MVMAIFPNVVVWSTVMLVVKGVTRRFCVALVAAVAMVVGSGGYSGDNGGYTGGNTGYKDDNVVTVVAILVTKMTMVVTVEIILVTKMTMVVTVEAILVTKMTMM